MIKGETQHFVQDTLMSVIKALGAQKTNSWNEDNKKQRLNVPMYTDRGSSKTNSLCTTYRLWY